MEEVEGEEEGESLLVEARIELQGPQGGGVYSWLEVESPRVSS